MFKFTKTRVKRNSNPYFLLTISLGTQGSSSIHLDGNSTVVLNELMSRIESTKRRLKNNPSDIHLDYSGNFHNETINLVDGAILVAYPCLSKNRNEIIERDYTVEEILEMRMKEEEQIKEEYQEIMECIYNATSRHPKRRMYDSFDEFEDPYNQEVSSFIQDEVLFGSWGLELMINEKTLKPNTMKERMKIMEKMIKKEEEEYKEKREIVINKYKNFNTKKKENVKIVDKSLGHFEIVKVTYYDEEEFMYNVEFRKLEDMIKEF